MAPQACPWRLYVLNLPRKVRRVPGSRRCLVPHGKGVEEAPPARRGPHGAAAAGVRVGGGQRGRGKNGQRGNKCLQAVPQPGLLGGGGRRPGLAQRPASAAVRVTSRAADSAALPLPFLLRSGWKPSSASGRSRDAFRLQLEWFHGRFVFVTAGVFSCFPNYSRGRNV